MLTSILGWIVSLWPGIGKTIVDLYRAKLEATQTIDAHTADMIVRELTVEQREAELQAQIVIAEQGNWLTRSIRPLWAMPYVAFTWKVVVYDKLLGLGTTDELHGWAATTGATIAGAYFVTRGLEKVAAILSRKPAK